MTAYAFNLTDQFRHSDGEMRYVYGRYFAGQLWCVWFSTPDDKRAHEALEAKRQEVENI